MSSNSPSTTSPSAAPTQEPQPQGKSIHPGLARSMGYKQEAGPLGKVYQAADGTLSAGTPTPGNTAQQLKVAQTPKGNSPVDTLQPMQRSNQQQPQQQQRPNQKQQQRPNQKKQQRPNQQPFTSKLHPEVNNSINKWNESTGLGLPNEFMDKVASIESNGNPNAKSPTGATGLFQFTSKTYKEAVSKWGSKYGIDKNTPRTDARASTLLAAEYMAQNRDALTKKIGREATDGETYMTHNLGLGGASRLIKAAINTPDAKVTKEMIGSKPEHNPHFLKGKTAAQAYQAYQDEFTNQ